MLHHIGPWLCAGHIQPKTSPSSPKTPGLAPAWTAGGRWLSLCLGAGDAQDTHGGDPGSPCLYGEPLAVALSEGTGWGQAGVAHGETINDPRASSAADTPTLSNAPSAPGTPTLPSPPSAPGAPNTPGASRLPNDHSAPGVPSAPGAPGPSSASSAPGPVNDPSVPSAPTLPSDPSAPSATGLPNDPTAASTPSAPRPSSTPQCFHCSWCSKTTQYSQHPQCPKTSECSQCPKTSQCSQSQPSPYRCNRGPPLTPSRLRGDQALHPEPLELGVRLSRGGPGCVWAPGGAAAGVPPEPVPPVPPRGPALRRHNRHKRRPLPGCGVARRRRRLVPGQVGGGGDGRTPGGEPGITEGRGDRGTGTDPAPGHVPSRRRLQSRPRPAASLRGCPVSPSCPATAFWGCLVTHPPWGTFPWGCLRKPPFLWGCPVWGASPVALPAPGAPSHLPWGCPTTFLEVPTLGGSLETPLGVLSPPWVPLPAAGAALGGGEGTQPPAGGAGGHVGPVGALAGTFRWGGEMQNLPRAAGVEMELWWG